MKKVLWISRHPLDQGAVEDLKKKYGEIEVSMKDIVFANNGKDALDQLRAAGHGYDVVGGVFPSQLWVTIIKSEELPFALFVVVSVPAAAQDGAVRTFVYDHIEFVD